MEHARWKTEEYLWLCSIVQNYGQNNIDRALTVMQLVMMDDVCGSVSSYAEMYLLHISSEL